MPLRPEDVAEMVSELVTLPEVYHRLNDMVERGDYAALEVGKVIGMDPALAARLLKLANSPYYGFRNEIDTVSRAVTAIGAAELRDLVLATYAVEGFSRVPNDLVDMHVFWQHSVYCAIASRILAGRCRVAPGERWFINGLLHDIGKLAMYGAIPELVEVIFARYQVWDGPLYKAEHSILGFHHGDVGAELMRLWGLPDSLAESCRYHHQPHLAGRYRFEASISQLANFASHRAGKWGAHMAEEAEVHESCWETTRLTEQVVIGAVQTANAQFGSMMAAFFPYVRLDNCASA